MSQNVPPRPGTSLCPLSISCSIYPFCALGGTVVCATRCYVWGDGRYSIHEGQSPVGNLGTITQVEVCIIINYVELMT